jgi:hypothetical protein
MSEMRVMVGEGEYNLTLQAESELYPQAWQ